MEKNIAKIRAPRGFSFKIHKISMFGYENKVCLHHNSRVDPIGYVRLVREQENLYKTHSYLDEAYRHKGLGSLLYARAIQFGLENGWKVRSSGGSSECARRVWRGGSIRKYFFIRTKKYEPNRDYDTWYAFAKKR